MGTPTAHQIESDTLAILIRVSPRPIVPTRESALQADLDFDSIQVLELVSELEDHFNISVPLNRLPQIRTVGQMVDALEGLLAERAGV